MTFSPLGTANGAGSDSVPSQAKSSYEGGKKLGMKIGTYVHEYESRT